MPVYPPPPSSSGGGGSVTFQDEGSAVGTATILNFVGAGVAATYSGGTATVTIPGGTAAGSIVFLDEGTIAGTATALNVVGSGGTVAYSGGTATLTLSGGGGADDPVADVFGTPDTAYEFDAALSGWTNLGTADAQDADSTVPGHYYVYKAATGSVAPTGIYRAVGSFPQTYITKITDHTVAAGDFARLGVLFVAEASPGVIEGVHLTHESDWKISHVRLSNPTTYHSTIGSDILVKSSVMPFYLGIVVNSSTDVDFWYSFGGRIWRKRTDARDPSITVGSFGIAVDPENGTHGAAAAFDYVRVWNSAKTFPGF